MKFRSDFVTNSSSSSFILARKGGLNERQKQAILAFVEKEFLGAARLSPDASEEDINAFFEEWWVMSEERREAIRRALTEGYTVSLGEVSFDGFGDDIASPYLNIWNIIKREAEEGTFRAIDTDLSY